MTEHIARLLTRPFTLTRIVPAVIAVCLSVALSAVAAEPAADAGEAPPGYRIAAEDVLDISVWREPDLSRRVIVRPDGGFSFPLVGNIQAAGLTPAELEADLRARLGTFVPDVEVTVSVQELRGMRVYVTGQVRNPGQYQVGRYVDVLQAVTLAGGFTPFADRRNVRIIRRDEDGREQVFKFNYRDVARGRNLEQNIQLHTDDVVLVP
jgi:polysaccharide biosynthesis/export protein